MESKQENEKQGWKFLKVRNPRWSVMSLQTTVSSEFAGGMLTARLFEGISFELTVETEPQRRDAPGTSLPRQRITPGLPSRRDGRHAERPPTKMRLVLNSKLVPWRCRRCTVRCLHEYAIGESVR